MKVSFELDLDAHFRLAETSNGFEARVLIDAWVTHLRTLLASEATTCSQINTAIARISEIAHEATEGSRPRLSAPDGVKETTNEN